MTTLKKVMVVLGLSLVAGGASMASSAQAQAHFILLRPDTAGCTASMLDTKGEWNQVAVTPRVSEQYLVRKKLILKFVADRFDDQPVSGYVAILTDTKPREIVQTWPVEIQDGWTFNVETQTSEGPVRIECSL